METAIIVAVIVTAVLLSLVAGVFLLLWNVLSDAFADDDDPAETFTVTAIDSQRKAKRDRDAVEDWLQKQ